MSGLQTVYPNVTGHPSKDIVGSNSKARWWTDSPAQTKLRTKVVFKFQAPSLVKRTFLANINGKEHDNLD